MPGDHLWTQPLRMCELPYTSYTQTHKRAELKFLFSDALGHCIWRNQLRKPSILSIRSHFNVTAI